MVFQLSVYQPVQVTNLVELQQLDSYERTLLQHDRLVSLLGNTYQNRIHVLLLMPD
ncbi:hypothetical protein SPJ1_0001 [Streptococcus parauberis KRS-02083]|uniref:Uncharacterized protein n=1 Tax=Streptococcus parauberis KRS-02083 TaxID=1207545 RepID=A0ABN0ITC5_9STRE|nr:hypothetical protein SPJ1_0001 [Streptococcus parauberis KRS-02083]